MIRYHLALSANSMFERLRKEESVLITPGIHFGLAGRYFRVGYGYDKDRLVLGLNKISEFLNHFRDGGGPS